MIFVSYNFLVFVAVTLILFWTIPILRRQTLLGASFLFFISWDFRFLLLHLAVSVAAFFAAKAIARTDDGALRSRLLWATVIFNLAVLFIFKYLNFFTTPSSSLAQMVWPIGLSYYTLQSLGYVIEVYWRKAEPAPKILDFLLFNSFFPQIQIGPIERYGRMRTQFERLGKNAPIWREGIFLICFGLFKKVVLAERFAALTHFQGGSLDGLQGWALLAFCFLAYFELYCDFSGYTDMARGVAKLFGINLVDNFFQPYRAVSPADIWRRWHYSLVSWLQDFVYWPLLLRTKNIYLTVTALMICVGLWHGPTFSFLTWALYWAVVYCAYIYWRTLPVASYFKNQKYWRAPMVAFMLLVSALSTLFLHSANWSSLRKNIEGLFGASNYPLENLSTPVLPTALDVGVLLGGLTIMIAAESIQHSTRPRLGFYLVAAALFLFLTAGFGISGDFNFIYMKY